MLCKKCSAVLPEGVEIEYCMVCDANTKAISNWVDRIMAET